MRADPRSLRFFAQAERAYPRSLGFSAQAVRAEGFTLCLGRRRWGPNKVAWLFRPQVAWPNDQSASISGHRRVEIGERELFHADSPLTDARIELFWAQRLVPEGRIELF